MKLIGLTGGIASGKSAAARMLKDAGVPVVDADVLAREAVIPGSAGLAGIVARFGVEMLAPDGTLDRKRLGARIFADDDERRALNAIVHPEVARLGADKLAALRASGVDVAVYEAPLLFENGLDAAMDATLLIAAPDDVQLARLMARDGLNEPAARARIAAQMPLVEKQKRATRTVENTGSLDDLAARLAVAFEELSGRSLQLRPT